MSGPRRRMPRRHPAEVARDTLIEYSFRARIAPPSDAFEQVVNWLADESVTPRDFRRAAAPAEAREEGPRG